jgi:hypothetical protein
LEGKSIGLEQKKKKLQWFGEPKCKIGFKVAHFLVSFVFFIVFKTFVAQIL